MADFGHCILDAIFFNFDYKNLILLTHSAWDSTALATSNLGIGWQLSFDLFFFLSHLQTYLQNPMEGLNHFKMF